MLINRSLSPVEVVFCLYPQVLSTYNEPARMELNYHAGISVHKLAQCMDEHLDLANIELDNEAVTKIPHTISFL